VRAGAIDRLESGIDRRERLVPFATFVTFDVRDRRSESATFVVAAVARVCDRTADDQRAHLQYLHSFT